MPRWTSNFLSRNVLGKFESSPKVGSWQTFVDDIRTSFWEEADDVPGRLLSLKLVGHCLPAAKAKGELRISMKAAPGHCTQAMNHQLANSERISSLNRSLESAGELFKLAASDCFPRASFQNLPVGKRPASCHSFLR